MSKINLSGPQCGSLQHYPDPLAGFEGEAAETEIEKGKEKERKGKRKRNGNLLQWLKSREMHMNKRIYNGIFGQGNSEENQQPCVP